LYAASRAWHEGHGHGPIARLTFAHSRNYDDDMRRLTRGRPLAKPRVWRSTNKGRALGLSRTRHSEARTFSRGSARALTVRVGRSGMKTNNPLLGSVR
jgi:hypothetical protein